MKASGISAGVLSGYLLIRSGTKTHRNLNADKDFRGAVYMGGMEGGETGLKA